MTFPNNSLTHRRVGLAAGNLEIFPASPNSFSTSGPLINYNRISGCFTTLMSSNVTVDVFPLFGKFSKLST